MCNDNKNKGPRLCLGWDSGAGRVWTAQRRAALYSRQECPASSPPAPRTWGHTPSGHGGDHTTVLSRVERVHNLSLWVDLHLRPSKQEVAGRRTPATSRGSRCAGNARVPVGEVAAERSAASRGKWGDRRKSCQQWLNKLEREIMWMRAGPAPALPSARKAGSHREKCVGWWETRVVVTGWGWWGSGGADGEDQKDQKSPRNDMKIMRVIFPRLILNKSVSFNDEVTEVQCVKFGSTCDFYIGES